MEANFGVSMAFNGRWWEDGIWAVHLRQAFRYELLLGLMEQGKGKGHQKRLRPNKILYLVKTDFVGKPG